MNNKFPNIYKALGGDSMRPAMQYAIIEDGKIVATNGNMLVVSDFSVFADNPELAENKVFDKDLLRWMTKKEFKWLECTEKGITAHKSGGKKEEMPYSGIWTSEEQANRAIYRYPDKTGHVGNFPGWRSVIPDDSQYAGFDGLSKIGCNAELLSVATGCFAFCKKQSVLKFEFLGMGMNNLVRITPLYERYDRFGNQCVYLATCFTGLMS